MINDCWWSGNARSQDISSHDNGLVARNIPVSGPEAWWRHQIETFSSSLAICAANSPVTGGFPGQRPVTRRFDVFFDLRLNQRLSKQSWGYWFERQSRPLLLHCNEVSKLTHGRRDFETNLVDSDEYIDKSMYICIYKLKPCKCRIVLNICKYVLYSIKTKLECTYTVHCRYLGVAVPWLYHDGQFSLEHSQQLSLEATMWVVPIVILYSLFFIAVLYAISCYIEMCYIETTVVWFIHNRGFLLLTWLDFNPGMDI